MIGYVVVFLIVFLFGLWFCVAAAIAEDRDEVRIRDRLWTLAFGLTMIAAAFFYAGFRLAIAYMETQ